MRDQPVMIDQAIRRERPEWEPTALHIPAPMPRHRDDEHDDEHDDSADRGRTGRVIVIDLSDYSETTM